MTVPTVTPPVPDPATAATGAALLDWAADPRPDRPRTLALTGPRGTGKTRLLAWFLAATAQDPRITVHAVGFAEGQTVRTLAWQLGRHLGYGPLEPADLVQRLAADPRPVLLLVADLHRAGRGPAHLPAASPAEVVDGLIAPLRALPGVRLLVETESPELLGGDDLQALRTGAEPQPAAGGTPPPAVPAGTDWRTVGPEQREHALDRAPTPDAARQLLTDPGYLVHGSVPAITAALADPATALPRHLREVWEEAAPALSDPELADSERAALLHAAASGRDPRLAEYLRPLAETSAWVTVWSLPGRSTAALTLVPGEPGAPASVVGADPLGRLTRRSTADGRAEGSPDSGRIWSPQALVAVDRSCLIGLDGSGILHPVPLVPGAMPSSAAHLTLHHNAETLAGAEGDAPGGGITALAASGRYAAVGDGGGRVHLWSLRDPGLGPRTIAPHRTAVTAVACVDVPDTGAVLLLTGGLDGTVRLWDSESGEVMPGAVERRAAVPTALAAAETEAGPVLAVAWSDRRIHLWHLLSGRPAALPALRVTRTLAITAEGLLLTAGSAGQQAVRLDFAALWADGRK